jgi:MEMO1 family protein
MIRRPVVANSFYPGDPGELARTLKQFTPDCKEKDKKQAIVAISPHAGYIYSGAVAGEVFSGLQIPEDVIILGPNHTGHGQPVSIMAEGSWELPSGNVPVNKELAGKLIESSSLFSTDTLAHRQEHSLEVQVPFLQFHQPKLTITPIVISQLQYSSCKSLGQSIAAVIKNYKKPVLIVASTDMSHYVTRAEAGKLDSLAIDRIKEMDSVGLFNTVLENRISMCGFIPTVISLIAARELGASKTEIIRYTDSGEVSGDTARVVGYLGMSIFS